ncbi:MAG: tetratricopeptide repeat protein [Bacteroidota bacterium]
MKPIFILSILFGLLACATPKQTETQNYADNEELKQIYKEDQGDRQSGNWSEIMKNDSVRLARVYAMVDSGLVRTSEDYANAAMVFQHGSDTMASGMAVRMMRKAIELDSTRNKWLLAAAIDRDLMRRDEPQIYGTQYIRTSMDNPWELYKIDTTQITDAERQAYGVETLAQQREKEALMNKKELMQMLNEGKSIEEVIAFCEAEDLKSSEYNLSQGGINEFGYMLMGQNRDEEALKVFELNTRLYPQGFNTFDSYGECLVKLGQIEAGIAAYEKSLELNPKNDNASRVLEDLKK